MGHVGERGPRFPLNQPPRASNWTLTQTGSNGSLVDLPGGIYLSATSRGVGEDKILASVAGGGAGIWSMTAGFQAEQAFNLNSNVAGIMAYESGTGKGANWGYYSNNLGQMLMYGNYFTSLTTTGSSNQGGIGAYPSSVGVSMFWLRMRTTATLLVLDVSSNGRDFIGMNSVTKTTPFTTAADRLGIYINPFNQAGGMRLFHWETT